MKIISRQEAKAKGLKRYFTGKACKWGHVVERWVSSKACVVCSLAYVVKWQKENPERCRANAAKWQKENPEKCRAYVAKWQKENPERYHACIAKWQKENPEKCRAYNKKRRENKYKDQAFWNIIKFLNLSTKIKES
jgi:hypothetical protein